MSRQLAKWRKAEGDTAWMAGAACRGADPRLFFPERGDPIDEAVAICATCEVFDQCATYAENLSINVPGVYAGLSQRDRRAKVLR